MQAIPRTDVTDQHRHTDKAKPRPGPSSGQALEISPSTFFNYFPTKEDVVLYDAYDPVLASLLLERPAGEPLSISFRLVLEAMGGIFERDRDIILARGRLWFEVPALRARLWEEVERAQVLMSVLIAQRSGRDADDFETRVTVMVMVTAALEAMREWLRRDGKGSFVALVNQALDMVEAGARLDSLSPSGERVRERGEEEVSTPSAAPPPRSSSPPTGRG